MPIGKRQQVASARAQRVHAPMFPDGVRPSPPMRPAHRSDMISPYRLGMTMTSNVDGSFTSWRTAESNIISSNFTVGYFSAAPCYIAVKLE